MVAEHTQCKGTENNEGKMNSIDECANACRKKSSMFVFGTNDFGGNGCDNQGCKCLCETGANADGSCENVQNKDYRLYRLSSLGKYEPYGNQLLKIILSLSTIIFHIAHIFCRNKQSSYYRKS